MADTGFTLFIKLVQLGSELIAQLLPKILKQGFDFATPQDFSKRNFSLKTKELMGKSALIRRRLVFKDLFKR